MICANCEDVENETSKLYMLHNAFGRLFLQRTFKPMVFMVNITYIFGYRLKKQENIPKIINKKCEILAVKGKITVNFAYPYKKWGFMNCL